MPYLLIKQDEFQNKYTTNFPIKKLKYNTSHTIIIDPFPEKVYLNPSIRYKARLFGELFSGALFRRRAGVLMGLRILALGIGSFIGMSAAN